MTPSLRSITIDDYYSNPAAKAEADALLAHNGFSPDDCTQIDFRGDVVVGSFLLRGDDGEFKFDGDELATVERVLS